MSIIKKKGLGRGLSALFGDETPKNTAQNDITYRVPDKEFRYTFKKNSKFETRYNYGFSYIDYLIHTNNLGFRDSSVKDIDEKKTYSIIIGDSFAEDLVNAIKESSLEKKYQLSAYRMSRQCGVLYVEKKNLLKIFNLIHAALNLIYLMKETFIIIIGPLQILNL